MDHLTKVVAHGIRAARVSLRSLARRAGVSHVQLFRIMRGERRATPTVARKVAQALDADSRTLARAATRIRQAERRGNR